MRKRLILVLSLVLLLAIGLLGCSPVRYVYQQPYQGVLTSANLAIGIGDSDHLSGTLTLDNHTIVMGYFYDINGYRLWDLQLGETYRLILDNDSGYYPVYRIEKLNSK